jgi:hypothetical protein
MTTREETPDLREELRSSRKLPPKGGRLGLRRHEFSSKAELQAQLCGKRNAYGRARTEEITQSACGNA